MGGRNMPINEILEPIIITYNRKNELHNTLNAVFAADSPIKACEITVLDNASDDGSSELCEEFCKLYPNLKHIRHRKNIGLAGNIIEAMKFASKKYLWILCDDDKFNWENWAEIEEALYKDYDAIHTHRNPLSLASANLINDEAFLPNVIYNTKHITDITIQNAYGIAHTLCPHHAIGCKILNENGKIFIPTDFSDIIIAGNNDVANKDYSKAENQNLYYKFRHYNIIQGYINAYVLIKDKKLRYQCMDVLCQGVPFAKSIKVMLKLGFADTLASICELLGLLSWKQKSVFILCVFRYCVNIIRKFLREKFKCIGRENVRKR